MNEFEWRRQLRDLRLPVAPAEALWQRIDAALEAPAVIHPLADQPIAKAPSSRQPLPWLMVASLAAISVLAGALGWQTQRQPGASAGPAAVASRSSGVQEHWRPADPRLSGAAIELDAARTELTQAMRQAPHSAALQRLLNQTEQQRDRLRQLEHEAG